MGERPGEPPRHGKGPEVEPDNDGTVDISAVQADDALLDALGGADTGAGGRLVDDELNALLLAWRQDTDADAMPELVDLDTAVAAVRSTPAESALADSKAAESKPGVPTPGESKAARRRLLVPVAAAAAVLVVGFASVSVAAKSARPGDALWGLTQVLYTDHARSVAAAAIVRTEFDTARVALSRGQISKARAALSSAGRALPTVAREDGRADLQATQQTLLARAGMPATEPPGTSSEQVTLTSAPPTTSSSAPVSPVPTGPPSSLPSASEVPPSTTALSSSPPPSSTVPSSGAPAPSSGPNSANTLSSSNAGESSSDRSPNAPEPLTATG